MATRKKEIKKPSFIITYAVCLLVSLIIVGGFGIVFGAYAFNQYSNETWNNLVSHDNELTLEICDFLNTDKEDLTRERIVWLRWILLNHYSETGRCAEVYYDNELIADSKSTLILKYNVLSDDEQSGFSFYTLEIADDKYLEYVKRIKNNLSV